ITTISAHYAPASGVIFVRKMPPNTFWKGIPDFFSAFSSSKIISSDSVSPTLPINASTWRHTSGSSPCFSKAWIAAWREGQRSYLLAAQGDRQLLEHYLHPKASD